MSTIKKNAKALFNTEMVQFGKLTKICIPYFERAVREANVGANIDGLKLSLLGDKKENRGQIVAINSQLNVGHAIRLIYNGSKYSSGIIFDCLDKLHEIKGAKFTDLVEVGNQNLDIIKGEEKPISKIIAFCNARNLKVKFSQVTTIAKSEFAIKNGKSFTKHVEEAKLNDIQAATLLDSLVMATANKLLKVLSGGKADEIKAANAKAETLALKRELTTLRKAMATA